LKDKIDELEDLSLKANQIIDLLKERRQALISAAVTGKIDVRGEGL
jgi:type I restriction enzyme S subunit